MNGVPRVATGEVDALGQEVTVSCASCHGNLPPNTEIRAAEQLREFHTGLVFAHGDLSCLTCHHAENYNLLRLADGRPLTFHQTQTLCAQCHVPQARDFAHGAHGGMMGYWDASHGAVYRKDCIDCHDPHAPQFPSMIPMFRPADRFLKTPVHGDHGGVDE